MYRSHKTLVEDNIAARNAAQELRSTTLNLTLDDPGWSPFYATVELLNRTFQDNYASATSPHFATTDKTHFGEHNFLMNLSKLVLGASYRTQGFMNYSKQIYLVDRLDNQWQDLKLDTQLEIPQFHDAYKALRRWVD